ncbi:Tubulin polyglutamylase complex subunit 1 [Brachionus plicatilis]|uniref:Tubulin polyglutamylase complex subunit 1 n=1 Tax=Brachionus plicatilis TaxID=10195 RepID=A0A3M7SSR3_BRAPC|nr:Tubulin polyglutamylase complex subunit 1 [Brachionus plicatilis]
MTDKNVKPVTAQKLNQQTEKPESDKVFLEKKNVKTLLTNLMDSLLHHQPKDPINYIYNYFDNLYNQGDPLKVAYDRLKVISHNSIMFDDCLLEIYQMFLEAATSEPNNQKEIKLSLADLLNRLIDLLTSDLKPEIKNHLNKKIKRREYEAFSFNYFKSSIRLIFLLKEFLIESKALYKDLLDYANDRPNQIVCDIIIDQLKKSALIVKNKNSDPNTIMQSLYEISPPGLSVVLNEKQSKIVLCRNLVDSEDFIRNTSMIFIDSINLQ